MRFQKPSTRLNSFREYCTKQGIGLLKDDLIFINKMLDEIDSSDYKAILMRYIEKWQEGIASSTNASATANLARKKANLWLLGYVDEVKNKKRTKSAHEINKLLQILQADGEVR